MTLKKQTSLFTEETLTSLQGDSLANLTQQQGNEKGKPMKDISFLRCLEQLKKSKSKIMQLEHSKQIEQMRFQTVKQQLENQCTILETEKKELMETIVCVQARLSHQTDLYLKSEQASHSRRESVQSVAFAVEPRRETPMIGKEKELELELNSMRSKIQEMQVQIE